MFAIELMVVRAVRALAGAVSDVYASFLCYEMRLNCGISNKTATNT